MASKLPQKVRDQMKKAGLPTGGTHPFKPKTTKNKKGEQIIEKRSVKKGRKAENAVTSMSKTAFGLRIGLMVNYQITGMFR